MNEIGQVFFYINKLINRKEFFNILLFHARQFAENPHETRKENMPLRGFLDFAKLFEKYLIFVADVREYKKEDVSFVGAITLAIDECIEN